MEHIFEAMEQLPPSSKMSQVEILATFDHIDLTEEETAEGLVWAKRRKEDHLKDLERKRREDDNRRLLTGQWAYNTTDYFMRKRAGELFGDEFKFDGQGAKFYEMLCCYFSKDPGFIVLAQEMKIKNPSLDKGLYLGGNFGVGKTWLMKLFQRNQRQVYQIVNAKAVADLFEREGEVSMGQFVECPKLPANDLQHFYQPIMGLCIDDLGTEEIKNHFGNKKNVVGDLIELRYSKGNTGTLLHITTNLTGKQLEDFYGGRVASRLRQVVNIIDFKGEDLRK